MRKFGILFTLFCFSLSLNAQVSPLPQIIISGSSTDSVFVARKASSGTINPGDVVFVTGFNAISGFVEVEIADADGVGTFPANGVSADTITNLVQGNIVTGGIISNIDTSLFNEVDRLFLSTSPGEITSTKPTSFGNCLQTIGYVLRSDALLGIVHVAIAGECTEGPIPAYGGISVVGNTVATEIATQNEFVQVTVFDTDEVSNGVVSDHTNDHLIIPVDGTYFVACPMSISSSGGGGARIMRIEGRANNGVKILVPPLRVDIELSGANDAGPAGLGGGVGLLANDTFELFVANTSGNQNIMFIDVSCWISLVE